MRIDFPMASNVVNLAGRGEYHSLFSKSKRYVIPDYQRNYSWQSKQITEFMESVKLALSGKTVFMGTVQYSDFDAHNPCNLIDGQQRMTTFLLLFKVLSLLDKHDYLTEYYIHIDLGNFKKSREQLGTVLRADKNDLQSGSNSENLYLQNASSIYSEVQEFCHDNGITAAAIAEKVLQNIYFVELVMTADMPISEMIHIFHTLNKTGMDLNVSDIFKLQYYDYLSKRPGPAQNNSDLMQKINALYDRANADDTKNIAYILTVYKHCIVAKAAMKFDKLSMSDEAFFEDIFSKTPNTLQDILQLSELEKIVDIYLDMTKAMNKGELTPYSNFAVDLIGKTRYSRYWTLPYVAAYFDTEPDKIKKFENAACTAIAAAKYLVECSVAFDRVINPVQTYMCELLHKISQNPAADVIRSEIRCVLGRDPYNRESDQLSNRNRFIERLEKGLFYNYKRADLVCTLSALIDEIQAETACTIIKEQLFKNSIKNKHDIEHIFAKNLFAHADSETVEKMNGIGNLVLLESRLNRSLKDKHLAEKANQYKESKYQSVKRIAKKLPQKGAEKDELETAKKLAASRLEDEKEKLQNFLYA